MLCVFDMRASCISCAFNIAGSDKVNQGAVLVHGIVQASGITHGATTNTGNLFTQIINSRLTFKHIIISRDSGFNIVDDDNPKKTLNLSQLSSGEKQEIVLFYDLIFSTKEKLLLLIDEPEISLHISWQKKFLDDLLEVAKHSNIQVIVATHSPQIVSNHMDIQIDLGELYGAELNKRKPN